jgi:hypothetical protein
MGRQDGVSGQAPRRNIELKATDPDPFASLDVCRRLGAKDRGTIEQRDTYFEVARGGLKLREEQPGPHLIQFERANEPQQRESRYLVARGFQRPSSWHQASNSCAVIAGSRSRGLGIGRLARVRPAESRTNHRGLPVSSSSSSGMSIVTMSQCSAIS